MITATAAKVLRYTLKDGKITGDLEALKKELKPDIRVVNNGIGHYEFWGFPSNDVRMEAENYNDSSVTVEIEDRDTTPEVGSDPELLVESLCEAAGMKQTFEFKDDDDVDEDDGRAYMRRRGTGITAEFRLQHKVTTTEDTVTTMELWYA